MDKEEEEEKAENIQQEEPTHNTRGAEGGAELALDPNNNKGEGSQLGARRKVDKQGDNCSLILISTSI